MSTETTPYVGEPMEVMVGNGVWVPGVVAQVFEPDGPFSVRAEMDGIKFSIGCWPVNWRRPTPPPSTHVASPAPSDIVHEALKHTPGFPMILCPGCERNMDDEVHAASCPLPRVLRPMTKAELAAFVPITKEKIQDLLAKGARDRDAAQAASMGRAIATHPADPRFTERELMDAVIRANTALENDELRARLDVAAKALREADHLCVSFLGLTHISQPRRAIARALAALEAPGETKP